MSKLWQCHVLAHKKGSQIRLLSIASFLHSVLEALLHTDQLHEDCNDFLQNKNERAEVKLALCCTHCNKGRKQISENRVQQ